MKTILEQNAQSRLEAREGVLCIVVETPFSAGASEASSPGMRQWFRVEEPDANPAQVGGRPVRNIDPQEGLFIDEERNSYRLAGGGHAEPFHGEVIPVEGGPGTRLKAGAAPLPVKQRGGNDGGLPGRRRRKGGERPAAIANEPFSEQPDRQELNLREKFAEVRRRLGYVQKRGHNERHNYNYVTAADLAGSVGDILAELGVVVIPQLQSISTETPRSSSDRIARVVMNYRFIELERLLAYYRVSALGEMNEGSYRAVRSSCSTANSPNRGRRTEPMPRIERLRDHLRGAQQK
jgi:hypothetical protein